LDTLVFDKTGTLTTGRPLLTDVRAFDDRVRGLSPDDVLALAAAVERRLSHPAAEAIVRAAEAKHLTIPERGDSHYAIGQGIEAEVGGSTVHVGSFRFFEEKRIPVPEVALATADEAAA